jgi:hypothetical protein
MELVKKKPLVRRNMALLNSFRDKRLCQKGRKVLLLLLQTQPMQVVLKILVGVNTTYKAMDLFLMRL